jgi:hypothetical protein
VGLVNILQAFGIALASSYIFWREVNPKAFIIFVVVLMVSESLIIFRRRMEMECPHCGFDPVLYVKNPEAACLKVKSKIELRQSDPDVWLARRPPLRFAKKRKKKNSTREIVA